METVETFAGKTVSKTWNEFPDFNVGDLVKLKSGGPVMTVDNASSSQIVCIWFIDQTRQCDVFHQGALEKVVEKPELTEARVRAKAAEAAACAAIREEKQEAS